MSQRRKKKNKEEVKNGLRWIKHGNVSYTYYILEYDSIEKKLKKVDTHDNANTGM